MKGEFLTCDTCWYGMQGFNYLLKSQEVIDKVEDLATFFCANDVVSNSTLCGAVKIMGDVLVPVVADTILGADFFCAKFLGVCDTPNYEYLPSEDFVKGILSRKPKTLEANDYLNKLYSKIRSTTNKT